MVSYQISLKKERNQHYLEAASYLGLLEILAREGQRFDIFYKVAVRRAVGRDAVAANPRFHEQVGLAGGELG